MTYETHSDQVDALWDRMETIAPRWYRPFVRRRRRRAQAEQAAMLTRAMRPYVDALIAEMAAEDRNPPIEEDR